ncbi:PREDICTED: protein SIEVE ELEMENT OCCLUSION B-like [Camelina sativa]|uniref:Protein SIEVE ELEMENT OCCLUSION B-like n=1 Tax=Camelina sativa TaxID=90675 RepID=A0ABM0XFT1_CAMSA|nr:PREDICTED: protein SIEVE ELEMENT OCCLUSION B-like [Camelina sativa]
MESLIKSQHAQQLAGHNSSTGKNPSTDMMPATGLAMSSDENMMLKLIQQTHSPDAREVQVRGLLSLVEDILDRATLDSQDTNASMLPLPTEDKLMQSSMMSVLDSVSYAIDRVACEV